MAERAIAAILESAHARWPRFSAVVAHRTGVVPVGETSVWIAVAAGHRAEAFEVARHLIDEVKASVPIWKREHLPEEPSGPPGVDTKQGVE
jgi:molybdopterin synthase catalytic subunit